MLNKNNKEASISKLLGKIDHAKLYCLFGKLDQLKISESFRSMMIIFSIHVKRNIFLFFIIFGVTFSIQAQQKDLENSPFRYNPQTSFNFNAHVIDDELIGGSWAQTSLFDMDGDGQLEFIMGARDRINNVIYVYKYHLPGRWTRYAVGEEPPTDVGGVAIDITGNGLGDIVSGTAWYRNSGDLNEPFEKIIYEDDNPGIHDLEVYDINGNGRLDVITMSDQSNLRWYHIPEDPTEPWVRHDIGEAVHGGISPMGFGDINGNGYTDVVRADVWFENVTGDGTEWRKHKLGTIKTLLPGALDGLPDWANGTKTWVVDVNGNGRNDVVQCDAEVRGGSIWWMENLGETENGIVKWRRHIIAGRDRVMGGMHSLFVGDFNGNNLPDVVTAEMDLDFARPGVNGNENPRYFLWENLGPSYDGILSWREHVIADVNLGGHEIVAGDVTGNGKLDIIGKPWRPSSKNALGGRSYVLFLHNVTP